MARLRSIKPEFWEDEKIAKLPRDARLLYIGLWNYADDYGVVKGNPIWLKSQIFPYDDIPMALFEGWLTLIEDSLRAHSFLIQGEKFLYMPYFVRHQLINRKSRRRNPEPPESVKTMAEIESNSTIAAPINEDSVSVHGGFTEGSQTDRDRDRDKEEEKKKTPPQVGPPQGVVLKNLFVNYSWFTNEKVTIAWDGFLEMRKRSKRTLNTERAIAVTLGKLQRIGGGDPDLIASLLDQSTANGWPGIWPLKEESNGTRQTKSELMDAASQRQRELFRIGTDMEKREAGALG